MQPSIYLQHLHVAWGEGVLPWYPHFDSSNTARKENKKRKCIEFYFSTQLKIGGTEVHALFDIRAFSFQKLLQKSFLYCSINSSTQLSSPPLALQLNRCSPHRHSFHHRSVHCCSLHRQCLHRPSLKFIFRAVIFLASLLSFTLTSFTR